MKVTPEEQYVLFEFKDHTFAFYFINSGQEVLTLDSICDENIIDYAFSFDGRSILFSTSWEIKIMDNPLCRNGVGLVGNNVKTMRDFLDILALSSWKPENYFDEGTHEHNYNKSLMTQFSKILITPYNWNLLHLLAVFLPQGPIIKIAIEQKIKITLDRFGWTPFHYLLHSDHAEPQAINQLFSFLLQNPKEMIYDVGNNLDVILDSIMKDLPLILKKVDPSLVNDLFKLSFRSPRKYRGKPNQKFGGLKNGESFEIFHMYSDVLLPEIKNYYVVNTDQKQFVFNILRAKLDYYTYSDDMLHTVEVAYCRKR